MMDDGRPFRSDLTRREVLALLGVGGLTALTPGCSMAQPVGTSPSVARSTPGIPIAAKRYDGGSGAAVFTGCIPLKPGQLVEVGVAGDRQLTMSLWNGATEVGSFATCLYPQHPDGSAKVLMISATLTLATGVELPLTLKLGTAPVVKGPAGHPTINNAWMKNPTLLGCTDAAHMCASRVAPYPLVPVDHPNLPASWKAFLTTEFDLNTIHFPSYGRTLAGLYAGDGVLPAGWPGNSANHNSLAPLYYRYMTTGLLDKLRDAHYVARSVNSGSHSWNKSLAMGGGLNFGNGLVKYAENYQGIPTGTTFPVDEYGFPFNPNPIGLAEHSSGFHHDAYTCYVLSGWPQVLGNVVSFGLRTGFNGTVGGVHWGNPAGKLGHGTSGNILHANWAPGMWAGARFVWRLQREIDVFYTLLSMPMTLQQSYQSSTIVESPRTHLQKHRDYYQEKYYGLAEEWSQHFDPHDPGSGHFHGQWGFAVIFAPAPRTTPPSPRGGYPAFSAINFFNSMMLLYLNVLEDPRLLTQMTGYANHLLTQVFDPPARWVSPGRPGTRPIYRMPYMLYSPKIVQTLDPAAYGTGYTASYLLAIWAWAYRMTGNTKFLAIADAHASLYSNLYTSKSGLGYAWKQIGETYQMAFAAAAWRAGETWGTVAEGTGLGDPPSSRQLPRRAK